MLTLNWISATDNYIITCFIIFSYSHNYLLINITYAIENVNSMNYILRNKKIHIILFHVKQLIKVAIITATFNYTTLG